MTYKTHFNFGILLAISFIPLLNINSIQDLTFYLICAGFAALIPDIDHKKSVIYRSTMPPLLILIIAFCIYKYHQYNFVSLLAWLILTLNSKHRTFSHSIYGLILFVIMFINTNLFIPFIIGYSSHLFSDMLTKEGIPLFLIKDKKGKYKRIGLGLITTGSKSERMLLYLLMIGNVISLFKILENLNIF